MTEPIISVIIPVGPAHVRYAPQAVASVLWQTAPGCEVIVVNDAGSRLPPHEIYSQALAQVLVTSSDGGCGPAVARNIGVAAARAPFVLCLDADDYLLPTGIETLLRGFIAHPEAQYVYGDVYTTIETSTRPSIGRTPDYDQAGFARYNLHVVTALVPTAFARFVGGFDEDVDGFEDWTLYLRLAIAGICGKRIPQLTMVYRTGLGERAKTHARDARALMEGVLNRYRNREGVIEMAGCGTCGGDNTAMAAAKAAIQGLPPPEERITGPAGTVRVEFVGSERGSVTYRHPQSGQSYTLGNNAIDRYLNVPEADLPWLASVTDIRIVAPVAPFVPPPDVRIIEPVAQETADDAPPTSETKAIRPKGRAVAVKP